MSTLPPPEMEPEKKVESLGEDAPVSSDLTQFEQGVS
jgi:hypothetical protein